eukprot:4279674-Pyramimonas_sp.AAC.1
MDRLAPSRPNEFAPLGMDAIRFALAQGEGQLREKELFMEQPAQGLPGLAPGLALRLVGGVFGLATAPGVAVGDLEDIATA